MMTNQVDKFTFKSLFATTLREKEDGYVVSELFSRYDSIQELLDVTEEELLLIKGIGNSRALHLINFKYLPRPRNKK